MFQPHDLEEEREEEITVHRLMKNLLILQPLPIHRKGKNSKHNHMNPSSLLRFEEDWEISASALSRIWTIRR